MAQRCRDAKEGDPIWNYQHRDELYYDMGMDRSPVFPNLFITIGRAEWLFPMHCTNAGYYPSRGHDIAGFASLRMYYAISELFLLSCTRPRLSLPDPT